MKAAWIFLLVRQTCRWLKTRQHRHIIYCIPKLCLSRCISHRFFLRFVNPSSFQSYIMRRVAQPIPAVGYTCRSRIPGLVCPHGKVPGFEDTKLLRNTLCDSLYFWTLNYLKVNKTLSLCGLIRFGWHLALSKSKYKLKKRVSGQLFFVRC